jgi:hypothetical protein
MFIFQKLNALKFFYSYYKIIDNYNELLDQCSINSYKYLINSKK